MPEERLTTPERYELERQESIIDAGVKTVFAVGKALQKIRDGRLYRDQYGTFADYCDKKWGFVRERARQLIAAAESKANLATKVGSEKTTKSTAKVEKSQKHPPNSTTPEPKRETQVRPLAGLPKETQKKAWAEATKYTDAPTEKQVEAAVEKVTKPGPKSLPNDDRGVPLPANRVELWQRRSEMAEHAKALSGVRSALKKAQEDDDPLYAHVNYSSTIAALDQAYHTLASCKPYCVCPMCQGSGCRACKKTGLLGKFQFKNIVPSELKKAGE